MLTREEIETTLSQFKNGNGLTFSGTLYLEALRTIVDLQSELDRLKAERRWVPVDQTHTPVSGKHVLLLCEIRPSGKRYVCDGFYAAQKAIVASGDDDGEFSSEYDEATDEYYLLEGWYEVVKNWDEYSSIVIEDFVIGWQPLPTVPKAGEL